MIQNILVVIGLIAVLLLLPRWVRRWRSPSQTWIETDQLGRLEDVLVVDVRGPAEFNGPLGHIPGALNIPVDEINKRLEELERGKQHPIVLVCKTDRRSTTASTILRERGFGETLVLRGGMEKWSQEGREIDSSGDVTAGPAAN